MHQNINSNSLYVKTYLPKKPDSDSDSWFSFVIILKDVVCDAVELYYVLRRVSIILSTTFILMKVG